jgi:N-acetyl-gamma-glutamylphosphate reductase
MATPKVFMIGATGFIGAAVYDLIYAKHPEYDYTALVRTKEKAGELIAHYPLTRAIVGDLNDSQLIESEAEKANIVISKHPH